MIPGRAGAILLVVAALAGCYRLTPPPALAEGIAVKIIANQGRLPRAQAELQAEVPRALARNLGWHITPASATARLELTIEEDIIDVTARDERGVPLQWQVRVRGTCLLVSRQATLVGRFTGAGYYSSQLDEPEGVRTAAQEAAKDIVAWIEANEGRFTPPPPALSQPAP
jgi:hypothetical protein